MKKKLLSVILLKQVTLVQILPILLLIALSPLVLNHLEVSHKFRQNPKTGATDNLHMEELEDRFAGSTLDIVAVAVEPDRLYAKETFSSLSALCEELAAVEGIEEVVSVTTIEDLRTSGDELVRIPLLEMAPDKESLKKHMDRNAMHRKMLMIPDGSGWNVLIRHPEIDLERQEAVNEVIEKHKERFAGLAISSLGFMNLENQRLSDQDLKVLTTLSFLIILIIHLVLTRRPAVAILLWITSGIAALLTLAIYPMTGTIFGNSDILVPIMIMTVATTYSIHLYRSCRGLGEKDFIEAFRRIVPTILMTSFTTLLGFAGLVFSPLEHLRRFGIFTAAGILVALLVSLYFLPPILMRLSIPEIKHKQKQRKRNSKWFLLLMLLPAAAVPFGLPQVKYDYRLTSYFPGDHQIHEYWDFFNTRFEGVEPLEIYIEAPTAYGFVDPEVFSGLTDFLEKLERELRIGMAISITDSVSWIHGRLSGTSEDKLPAEDWEIGEALELLSGDTAGGSAELISPEWDIVKITLLLGFEDNSYETFQNSMSEARNTIPALFRETFSEDFTITLGGEMIKWDSMSRQLASSLVYSMLLFFPIVFLILLLILRHPVWALLPLVAPLTTILILFGVAGTAGIAITNITSFALAMIMGVSIDDSIFFFLTLRRKLSYGQKFQTPVKETQKETGKSIFQTTLIICLALIPLFFSNYKTIRETGVLMLTGFPFAMALTLAVIPRLTEALFSRRHNEYADRISNKVRGG